MLALKSLPESFRAWNLQHGAPNGHERRRRSAFRSFYSDRSWRRLRGAFAIQGNNSIRAFEYPWAFHIGSPAPGMRALDIGGGLCGFQFALSQAGVRVVNVDPGMDAHDWPVNESSLRELNELFETDVELRNCTIAQAGLEEGTYDRAYSISVLEHLPKQEIETIVREVYRALKPGGLFILTVDLFLNVAPFTSRQENAFGANWDVYALSRIAPFELVEGKPEELFGFPEFNAERVLSQLESYLIGDYPALAQCLVLRKPR